MRRQRLIVLFLLGFIFLNAPLLTIFSRDATVGGVPLLYAYLFVVWAVLILGTGWIVERSSHGPDRLDA